MERIPAELEQLKAQEHHERAPWQVQKEALKKKFPEGWNPRKKLSPDAMTGIRALNRQFPEEYTAEALAKKFEVSPEAIRRILRSKWAPSPEEELRRQARWFQRGKAAWTHFAALGMKPPRKWRKEGVVRDPSYHEWRRNLIKARQEEEATEESAQRKLAGQLM